MESLVDTLIIGAGPSGLAAAFRLTEAGVRPMLVEQQNMTGGLMRSIRRGDFVLDIGRKELYTRIPEVDRLWRGILGSEYREYGHRVGSLYRGRILELSGRYRGLRRGLPWPWLIAGGVDLVRCWTSREMRNPSNYQEYWHRRAGRRFSRLFAQGYWEKFSGERWVDRPVPDEDLDGGRVESYSFRAIRQGLRLASQGGPVAQQQWRHPARGTGQICDEMASMVQRRGATLALETRVAAMIVRDCRIAEVHIEHNGARRVLHARNVVSSLQIEQLPAILSGAEMGSGATPAAERSVVLVYLFLNEAPRFPHAWLEVNDTRLRAGRITNYAAFNGTMVPPGKTCLCVEFFCADGDPLREFSSAQLEDLARRECVESRLIDPAALADMFVLRMKRSNPAASWRDWQRASKLALLEKIRPIRNLYHVNRPGADWATFAGLMAAEAILQGDRTQFDRRADPTRKYKSADQASPEKIAA